MNLFLITFDFLFETDNIFENYTFLEDTSIVVLTTKKNYNPDPKKNNRLVLNSGGQFFPVISSVH